MLFVTTTVSASGVVYDLTGDLFVTASGAVLSTGATAVTAKALVDVTVAGTIAGDQNGVEFGPSATAGAELNVLLGGSVVGGVSGVHLSGSETSIANAGAIHGDFAGVTTGIDPVFGTLDANPATATIIANGGSLSGNECGLALVGFSGTITNTGAITSTASGLLAALTYVDPVLGRMNGGICATGNDIVLLNSGTVSAGSTLGYGIAVSGSGTTITNSGVIQTASTAFQRCAVHLFDTAGQATRLTNTATGHIFGNGDAVITGDGDDTLTNRGEISGNVWLGGGNDVFDGRDGRVIGTVFAGDGEDLVRTGNGETSVFGGNGNDTLIGGSGDDVLSGGADNDTLLGRAGDDSLSGGDGNDSLSGGAGQDFLSGGFGYDLLRGGADADSFVYSSRKDSPSGSGRDVILDFEHGIDHADLSAIDANTTIGGNQAFTFIGGAAFTAAGQIAYDAATGLLSGDVNGDGKADFQIKFANLAALSADDFIL